MEIPQQHTSFQTFHQNMMQYLTKLMPQPWVKYLSRPSRTSSNINPLSDAV